MKRINNRGLAVIMIVISVLAVTSVVSFASPIAVYTDRTAWEAATGGPEWEVDFEGYADDTPFRTTPVDAGPFSLLQTGSAIYWNEIKAAGHAAIYTNFGDTTVAMTFDEPLLAWGADFSNVNAGEKVNLELVGGGNVTIEVEPDVEFFGFEAPSGETLVSKITFVSRTEIAGSAGEIFILDNVAGVTPEPATLVMLAYGLPLAIRRRRRNQNQN